VPAGIGPDALPVGAEVLLSPLVVDPGRTALLCDFDGTLAPIVEDPASARPLGIVPALLAGLARRFATMAVVSGRPATFLADRLILPVGGDDGGGGPAPLRLVGLYGLESVDRDGNVRPDERVAPWLAVVAEAADRLRDGAPAGVLVEVKGSAVTVHWRRAPDAGGWATARVAEESDRTGLVPHPGRLSVELRPPLAIDKGTVVEQLTSGCSAACFLGDDLGDLPAFAALGRLAAMGAMTTVGVAVQDAETAPEVAAAADLVVDGPEGAVAVLAWLDAAGGATGLR
jgi:trehalose 6-phosphate phosphatase